MVITKIDARQLKDMFIAGAKRLDSRKDEINELNVFPVPDGDTGTNMTMTIMSAVKEVEATDEPTMENLAKAISQGALRGARGNSGVILSQLFRGFTRAVKKFDCIDKTCAPDAFKRASETAYKAVMKPKEGTILTVARGMSEKAQDIFEATDDMAEALRQIIEYGNYMLSLTPEMLPVLKQAGVVDSGGKGLMTILEGAYDKLMGVETDEEREEEPQEELPAYGYCTEFILMMDRPMTGKEEKEWKDYLSSIGDTLVCAADKNIVKVHVHTDNPGLVLEEALKHGSLSSIKVENMKEEHHETLFEDSEKLSRLQKEEEENKEKQQQAPPKDVGFIAVAMGSGLKEIFEGLGVDFVVEGGQTMNPSTADILDAVEKVNARTVYVMPNNKNIILAAQQAVELCSDKHVIVIPSKNVPQGIAAVINYCEGMSDEDNTEAMTEGMAAVKSAQVTFAVRDTTIDDKQVHQGDIMGISDAGLAVVGRDLDQTVLDTIATMTDSDSEIITIYYGSDVKEEDAQALQAMVMDKYTGCDVELHKGGQPIYYYIISVE